MKRMTALLSVLTTIVWSAAMLASVSPAVAGGGVQPIPFVELVQQSKGTEEAIVTLNSGIGATGNVANMAFAGGNLAAFTDMGTGGLMPSVRAFQEQAGNQRAILTVNGPGITGGPLTNVAGAIGNAFLFSGK